MFAWATQEGVVIPSKKIPTLWIQESRNAVFFVDDMECCLETVPGSALARFTPVDQVGTVAMDEGRESQAVTPR